MNEKNLPEVIEGSLDAFDENFKAVLKTALDELISNLPYVGSVFSFWGKVRSQVQVDRLSKFLEEVEGRLSQVEKKVSHVGDSQLEVIEEILLQVQRNRSNEKLSLFSSAFVQASCSDFSQDPEWIKRYIGIIGELTPDEIIFLEKSFKNEFVRGGDKRDGRDIIYNTEYNKNNGGKSFDSLISRGLLFDPFSGPAVVGITKLGRDLASYIASLRE